MNFIGILKSNDRRVRIHFYCRILVDFYLQTYKDGSTILIYDFDNREEQQVDVDHREFAVHDDIHEYDQARNFDEHIAGTDNDNGFGDDRSQLTHADGLAEQWIGQGFVVQW